MRRVLTWLENVLRHYPWTIPLVALVPCAYFAAQGTNDLFAASLFKADTAALARPLPARPGAGTRETTASSANHHVRDRTAIIHRNVFDSDAGCLDCDAAAMADDAAVDPGGPPVEDTRPPEPCDSTSHVVGAVESEDPLWSFIFVQAQGSTSSMPYRFGQTLDSKTVGLISWHPQRGAQVVLRSGSTRCYLAQNMPPRQAPATPATPAPAAAATPGGGAGNELQAALDQGIERSGANEFNVRRGLVDRILENQAELMRTTRIMPHEEGGRVVGVQLFGVRGNSLLGRLGLQNGDVLNRINGLDIASPDRALEAYSRLRSSDRIQVSVTRNGQPVNIDFNIR